MTEKPARSDGTTPRERLKAFESGDAPFVEEATEAYGEDVSAIEATVAAVAPEDTA